MHSLYKCLLHNIKKESLSLQHSKKHLQQPMKTVFMGTNPQLKEIHQRMLRTQQALKEGTWTTSLGGHQSFYSHLLSKLARERQHQPWKGRTDAIQTGSSVVGAGREKAPWPPEIM
jgi:hypothetical protein